MNWKRLLAYITGTVDQELLLRNEYLAAENCILRNQIHGRLRLADGERITLAEIGQRLGRKALAEVAQMVRPETILPWHRKLVAKKFDGSKNRSVLGRPSTIQSLEELGLQMARDNRTWGYKRITGALKNLGHQISRQTVGNILKRHGLAPAPERGKGMHWKDFIQSHLAVFGRRGSLYRRGLDVGRVDDLLRAGVHAGWIKGRSAWLVDPGPGCGLDAADGPEPDDGRAGDAPGLPISAARPRCQVLCCL